MSKPDDSFFSDESSEEEEIDSDQNDFGKNRASLDDYEANRNSLSDIDNNRLSFSTDHDNPFSDQESVKEFSEFLNDNHQAQSESNSEEESKPHFQASPPPIRTDKVTFYKHGQPTRVVHKSNVPPNSLPNMYSASQTDDSAYSTCSSSYSASSGLSNNHSHPVKRTLSCSDSSDLDEPPARKMKYDDLAKPVEMEPQSLEKAKAMMEKMGYKEGRGLGKHSQGRVVPVEMSKQRGRRGLGLSVPGLEPAQLTWDHTAEVVKVEEEPCWLVGDHLPPLDSYTLESWKEIGPRSLNIEECTDFCDPAVLHEVLSKKSLFDSLGGEEMRRARTRSNPFETIGKGIFLNRAAMKMANMDRVFDFMFTSPKNKEGQPVVGKDQLLYFADVCAGPGGFSEYVLWRRKWRAKGFGFTLKGECDFKLADFLTGPCETFEPYYGVNDDGNVFDPANIESLMHFVMDHTQQIGVHFMMADGGFSVEGQENVQELLSKQLYLCQFLVALCIVRTGGHFVCKLFDIFSPFSVGLVYLMYRAFECISIHKPNTSRPANSERYIICKWKREDCEPTREYLFNLNKELNKMGSKSKEDINLCVSMEELMHDKVFFDYIVKSNNELGHRQVVNLVKISAFCRDVSLTEQRQSEVRRSCLLYWNVPDFARKIDKSTPEDVVSKRLHKCNTDFLQSSPAELYKREDLAVFRSIYDWHCFPVASHKEVFIFVGLGRNKVYRLAQGGKHWKKVEEAMELSPGTMVFGELVQEYQGEFRSQLKKKAFHIIDAISLGDEDVSHLHYTERLKLCELYSESLYKSTRRDLCRLRAKMVYYLQDINSLFQGLTMYVMKNGTHDLLLQVDDEFAYQAKGVMFFNATKSPYTRHLSRSTNFCYYDRPGFPSKFDKDRPQDACATTIDCLEKRQLWKWEQGAGIHQEPPREGVLHRDHFLEFVNARLGPIKR